jgi:hypothetical protein
MIEKLKQIKTYKGAPPISYYIYLLFILIINILVLLLTKVI